MPSTNPNRRPSNSYKDDRRRSRSIPSSQSIRLALYGFVKDNTGHDGRRPLSEPADLWLHSSSIPPFRESTARPSSFSFQPNPGSSHRRASEFDPFASQRAALLQHVRFSHFVPPCVGETKLCCVPDFIQPVSPPPQEHRYARLGWLPACPTGVDQLGPSVQRIARTQNAQDRTQRGKLHSAAFEGTADFLSERCRWAGLPTLTLRSLKLAWPKASAFMGDFDHCRNEDVLFSTLYLTFIACTTSPSL
jgi:hypothetical protein